MKGWQTLVGLGALLAVAATACAGPGAQPGQSTTTPSTNHILSIATRVEPAFVAGRGLTPTGLTLTTSLRLFNAGLVILDGGGTAQPYLSENVPALNTDTWQVFPDGRMETTYRLRPGLTWHDGTPLTADDMVFAWQVFSTPAFGLAQLPPEGQIGEIVAQDDRTILIRWSRLFPKADQLQYSNLGPMPRHLLEQSLHDLDPNAFLSLPFWTVEYVGAGPFRLDHWESGAYFDVSAFDGHALGRPQIDRIHVTFIGDANTALANLLSGEVSLVVDDAMTFQQAAIAQKEWDSTHAGTVIIQPGLWRTIQIQQLPERQGANAHALSDVRARKALMYTIDKQAINDSVYEGQAILADSVIPPTVNYYPEVNAAVVKYPFDPARAEQLMSEVGYGRGSDGFYASPVQGRFSPELMITQGAQNATVQQILASTWRQMGFDISQAVLPQAQAQDPQVRAMFEAMVYTGGSQGEDQLPNFGSNGIPRPENRWNGSNRGSWTNPEFDRLLDAYNTTLDANQRAQEIAQLAHIFSDELPSFSINFDPGPTSFRSNLSGPAVSAPGSSTVWNIWQWQVQ